MLAGGILSVAGIAIAYYLYIFAPGSTLRIRDRARGLHDFLFHKWYFDELLDALVYRPVVAFGRFSNDVFERYVVNGVVLFTSEGVRGMTDTVRSAQSGFVRSYALLVVAGIAGLGLYFLIASS
jgi:NADH-quinone oxidoreductase subunit L